jgi:hypothetical protein
MKPAVVSRMLFATLLCNCLFNSHAQQADSIQSVPRFYKNVIRYNLSGALLFGADRYVVFGFERVLNKKQSISLNVGRATLPKLIAITTDSFSLQKDLKNTGKNISVDYRFYLAKENRYLPPRGVYIGPYYSYNLFERNNEFNFKRANGTTQVGTTNTKLNIHTVGVELGYQFVLWKRLALDLLLIGPGVSAYDVNAKLESSLTEAEKEQLRDALQQVLTQRFPGLNYVLGDDELDGNGALNTTSVGFRYIIHIGFVF